MGWYHSHPGYGCWLSGIDVGTQMTQQQYLDPFLAIVVDPHRTVAAGKVEIGAFRTFPAVGRSTLALSFLLKVLRRLLSAIAIRLSLQSKSYGSLIPDLPGLMNPQECCFL